MMKAKSNPHEDLRDATHVFIAYAACGCVRAIATDVPACGSTVGKWIKERYRVEHVSFEVYRTMIIARCPHKKTEPQANLFAPEGA